VTASDSPAAASAGSAVSGPQVWLHQTFAPKWFADMSDEATQPGGDARRREIIFSVCFVESYLLEWTRDEPLNRDFGALDRYLPADDRKGIVDRWKRVTKRLLADDRIMAHPNYSRSAAWADFIKLVRFRDGLIHARTGRPQTGNMPRDAQPTPTIDELNKMQWAGQDKWRWRSCESYTRQLERMLRRGSSTPE
jgi:hypothetical protein